jgi:hypothetical protein
MKGSYEMNTGMTQFFLAAAGIVGLILFGMTAMLCLAFGPNGEEQVFRDVLLLVAGALATIVGTAGAFFFRINGHAETLNTIVKAAEAVSATVKSVPPA